MNACEVFRRVSTLALLASLVVLLSLAQSPAAQTQPRNALQLTSAAFTEGKSIPAKYTCDGSNVSPPLNWSGVPAIARSLVLLVEDPDAPAGTWVHWIAYNLPVRQTQLAENQPQTQILPSGGNQGLNDFKKLGYGGPCPPPGKPHRYFFKLYALDIQLSLPPSPTKKDVQRAMQGHVLAQGQLVGTYQR